MHLGSDHPFAREVEVERAVIAVASGDEDAGLARLFELVASVSGDDASTRIDRGIVLLRLGEALLASGRSDEAVSELVEATELLGSSWVESVHAEDAARLLARAQSRAQSDVGRIR
jgi:Flp pilus assembly protein TadD